MERDRDGDSGLKTAVAAERRAIGSPRRRRDDPGGPQPVMARWPLEIGHGFELAHPHDPWVAIVHQSIADYAAGQADRASHAWHDEIIWCVSGAGPLSAEWVGPEEIFSYHSALERLSGGTFRQSLVSLEASGGPIVEAHVRTTATRPGRSLDIPTLLVFELAGGRLRRVTEIAGDLAAWDGFWTD